ncbi:S1 family peptidase [Marinitenerispora sediminis]|uniref:Serine protease n=1 Tax=Marinitenerispora sediminis TaxID=1931232 RepID=A0A368T194_9ACTN|nr:S1 family peptidase [Marinitenerispora sediminis]RCV51818.1 serine protease [Marinitenerispora sediminis]RCV53867.1 serine protease [Marinitenerispora sediminis]RCV54167.1 serine protease [Marinitenerispora sediminis]
MRKSPVFRALGGTAFAIGLVVAAAPAASASPETLASSPEQVTAMERDLGLSTAEVTRLLQQEEQARTLEQEVRETLGEDFAGAVFDIETGELTVSVTDRGAVEAVREAGAVPRVVAYGEGTLDQVVEELNANVPDADAGVTGWYVDLADDTVVMTVREGATDVADDLIAEAGVDAAAVRVVESSEQPQTFATIRGGDAYYIGSGSRCSIGFSVSGGFVTAGHCGGVGASTRSSDGTGTGTVAGSSFPGRDMGWVRATSNWSSSPLVNRYNGGTVTVTGSTESAVGASICRSGSTTGWRCGTVQAKNQTVIYPQGSVSGLTRTNACAEPGDSGGSWLSGSQAQGVTSGGSGNCSSGGTTYFQPVNPILSQYGLTLTRG